MKCDAKFLSFSIHDKIFNYLYDEWDKNIEMEIKA